MLVMKNILSSWHDKSSVFPNTKLTNKGNMQGSQCIIFPQQNISRKDLEGVMNSSVWTVVILHTH